MSKKNFKLVYIIGIIAIIICMLLILSLDSILRSKPVARVVIFIGVIAIARLYILFKMSSKLPEKIEYFLELKNYTLYLRGFSLDKKFPVNNDPSIIDTAEVLFSKMFKPSFITIGKPNESNPTLGAKRAYLSNDEWQYTVQFLIIHAKIIIIRIDHSEGIKWELNQIIKYNMLQKTILYRSIYEDTSFSWKEYLNFLITTFDISIPNETKEFQFITFNDSGCFYDDRFSFFHDLNKKSWLSFFKNRKRLHLIFDTANGKIPFWSWSRYFNGAIKMNTLELHIAEINTHLQKMGLVPLKQQKKAKFGKIMAIFTVITFIFFAMFIIFGLWYFLTGF